MSAVLRFAPSPNGELHLGHALSAILTHDMATALGGRFLVRIEDIDTVRCRPTLIARCLADLAWLGLAWEEPVLRQSTRFPAYAEAAARAFRDGPDLSVPRDAKRIEAASKEAGGAVDPDGAPLYQGAVARSAGGGGGARREGRSACAAARHGAGGGSRDRDAPGGTADIHRARRGWRAGHRCGAAGAVGRRGADPQGHACELSSGGGGGRRIPGHHACHARTGSLRGHGRSPTAAGPARVAGAHSYHHHRLVTDESLAESSRKARGTPRSPSCVRKAGHQRTCGAPSGCPHKRGR